MKKVIAAVFKNYAQAEKASAEISQLGYNIDKMSIISKNSEKRDKETPDSDVTVEGSMIGGTLGLLFSLGMVAIPGIGVLAAAGPLAGILSGALAGGLIGALVDVGIPENEGKEYETHIKSGQVLWTMGVDEKQPTDKIESILKNMEAVRVTVYE